MTPPVLVAGAGPTGLALAMSLARRNIPFRIIDASPAPGTQSRAMVVHARTLEFYRQFGFAQELIDEGVRIVTIRLRGGQATASHELVTASLQDFGAGISPYPFVLSYPQDDHERFLVRKLGAMGISVERGCRLAGLSQDGDGVRATLEHADGRRETFDASYLCGADGARSTVREALNVPFPGGTYAQLYFVADVRVDGGFDRDLVGNFGEDLLALMLPVRLRGMQRLIGLVPRALTGRTDLTFEDVRHDVEQLIGVRVSEVNWFSTYKSHHRVAQNFQRGRVFLLGDAGHVHSPVGGQGMNTGIGDAINLGWKLAMVIEGRFGPSLLDTYEPERIAFARQLVATTDRAFSVIVAGGIGGELIRRVLAPMLLRIATRFRAGQHLMFRTVSQTRIHYRASPMSEGSAGEIHGGDRLPWTEAGEWDNHAPLDSLDWQVHVYGDANPVFVQACTADGLPLHQFPWRPSASRAGFTRDAAYLVRPDGYIGWVSAKQEYEPLAGYLNRISRT